MAVEKSTIMLIRNHWRALICNDIMSYITEVLQSTITVRPTPLAVAGTGFLEGGGGVLIYIAMCV